MPFVLADTAYLAPQSLGGQEVIPTLEYTL